MESGYQRAIAAKALRMAGQNRGQIPGFGGDHGGFIPGLYPGGGAALLGNTEAL